MKTTLVFLGAFFCLNAAAQISLSDGGKGSDEALIAEAEKLVNDEAAKTIAAVETKAESNAGVKASTETAENKTEALKEADIPVLVETKKEAKSEGGLVWRLIGSIAFIAIIGGAMVFAGRRFTSKKNVGGTKARIETLHQIHFGPRKSLALVRVAGEVILIGITDQNISMLKQVMLIDDELENVMGQDFNKFLQDDFAVEDVRNAISRA